MTLIVRSETRLSTVPCCICGDKYHTGYAACHGTQQRKDWLAMIDANIVRTDGVIDPKRIPAALMDIVLSMGNNPVRDYVIPGLTSSLVGGNGHGQVRMFTQERHHEEPITPHSHRFDFCCLVLRGVVHNRVWTPDPNNPDADLYHKLNLVHHGKFGQYNTVPDAEHELWGFKETKYIAGEWYSMKAEEVHSIFFSKQAVVLFIEAPNRFGQSFVLEPISNGKVIPTFRVDHWMFGQEGDTP